MYPFVKTAVIMAFIVNISQLSVKYQWNGSICEDIGDCGVSSKYFQLSVKYRRKHLDIRRWCFKKNYLE